MKLTFYESQFTPATDGEASEMSWEEFVEEILSQPEVVPSKGSETQYFPGELRPNPKSKGDDSVLNVQIYACDMDAATDAQVDFVERKIQEMGLSAVLHSTHSHFKQRAKDGTNRVRALIPTSRPVLPGEYRLFWANMRVLLGNVADATTASPAKHYLVPSRPPGPGPEAAYIFRRFKGKPIDVDKMLTMFRIEHIAEAEIESFEIGRERITQNMLKVFLDRRRKGPDSEIATAIKKAIGRLTYAEEGSREATLFGIAGLLAKEFPKGNPDDLCEPLRYSVEFEERQGGPKFNEFRDKVIRRQRDCLMRVAQKALEAAKEEARIAQVRDTVSEFTPDTLATYFKQIDNRIDFRGLSRALILVHRNMYFVFTGHGYTPATAMSLQAVVRDYLRYRAEEGLGFSYYYPNENGKPPVEKTADHLVRDHGQSIREVRYTYAGASFFDLETKILWLSEVASPKRLTPQRSEKVEAWMRAVVGGDEAMLHRWEVWMSQFPDTERALAGLCIFGPSGIGKSAFAAGMAKMFGDNPPCSMRNYLSNFNSEVLGNPLVFADETMPEVNGKVPTEQLRTLISSRVHEVNRKNHPIVVLDGFVRTILAFQSARKFDFGRGHGREDIEAISKRFLFINGHAGAEALFDFDHMVNNLGFAKHALYLAEHLTREDPRFGVYTESEDTVLGADPVAMSVLDWVVEYLWSRISKVTDPTPPLKRVAAFVHRDRIFVSPKEIKRNWDLHLTGNAKYTPTQLTVTEAVRSIAKTRQPQIIKLGDKMSYYEVRRSLVEQRLFFTETISHKDFEALMRCPHELAHKGDWELTNDEKRDRLLALRDLGFGAKT